MKVKNRVNDLLSLVELGFLPECKAKCITSTVCVGGFNVDVHHVSIMYKYTQKCKYRNRELHECLQVMPKYRKL